VNIWLEDFNQHLTVAGFKNVKVKDVNNFFQAVKEKTEHACVQFFDSSLVAGSEHLRFAALNALNAFKGNVNISSSLAMETLLYASAQRQIKEAVRLIGIKPSTSRVAVLILTKTSDQASAILKTISELVEGRRDDSVINLTESKMAGLKRLFKISDLELEAKKERKGAEKQALTDLVIEHMALLVTQR
jgi:tRNA threonylcarbamoyladenosine modification (KEOPS) complex Cgi121 subunit